MVEKIVDANQPWYGIKTLNKTLETVLQDTTISIGAMSIANHARMRRSLEKDLDFTIPMSPVKKFNSHSHLCQLITRSMIAASTTIVIDKSIMLIHIKSALFALIFMQLYNVLPVNTVKILKMLSFSFDLSKASVVSSILCLWPFSLELNCHYLASSIEAYFPIH